MADDCLDEVTRAEDVLLGALGFDADARIIAITKTEAGFSGLGQWSDGESFEFESEDELSDLERWAVEVLMERLKHDKAS